MFDNNSIHADTLISVCIATYRRPEQLDKLLESLTLQELPPNISLEIVVVDNDKEGGAKNIIQKYKDSDICFFKYYVQPVKNISLTRNLAVQNSTGKFICFIDDDETADRTWVNNFYNSLLEYNAQGAFGYVVPIFDEGIPEYMQKREFYFTPLGETGTPSDFTFTTNAIVETAVIKNEDIPFNPDYGLTGGEDAHLFERLILKGARFINCQEAITFEYIPKERGTKQYLFNRSLRGGQSYARRMLEFDNIFILRIFIIVKAIIIIFISFLQFIFGFLNERYTIKSIISYGSAVGKIRSALNIYKKLY